MSSKIKKRNTGCPIAFAMDIFGDKWSLVIIRDLMFSGRQTYGEFLEAGEGIATNVLADKLKKLEVEGLIIKLRDPDNLRRYIYQLTEKGTDLAPMLLEIIRWAGKYDPQTAAPEDFLRQIKQNRERVIIEIHKILTEKQKKSAHDACP